MGRFEILASAEVIDEVGQGFIRVSETRVGDEPVIKPQDRAARIGGVIECGEDQ